MASNAKTVVNGLIWVQSAGSPSRERLSPRESRKQDFSACSVGGVDTPGRSVTGAQQNPTTAPVNPSSREAKWDQD